MKNMLWLILCLTIGALALPYLVGVVMDVFAITIYRYTGWDLSVSFMENTLAAWPGGEVIAALVFNRPSTFGTIVVSVFQLLVVVAVRSLIPSVFATVASRFQLERLLLVGFVDVAISCLVAIGVGWLFALGISATFESFVGPLMQWIAGLGSLALIGVAAAGVLGAFKAGDRSFAWSVITAVGRYVLATLSLITWSMHATAGSFMIIGCIVASGFLHVVDGAEGGLWKL